MLQKRNDEVDGFEDYEWHLVQVMASIPCAAWVISKRKILEITAAMFHGCLINMEQHKRYNSAFRRMVRHKYFIRTMPSNNGQRETHYEMNQGLFDKS